MGDNQVKIGPADDIIERLQRELGLERKRGYQKVTAELLRITPQALVRWRRRGFVGVDKIVALCLERNLDMNVVFRGQPIEQHQPQQNIELVATESPRYPVVEFENLRDAVDQMGIAIGVQRSVRNEEG